VQYSKKRVGGQDAQAADDSGNRDRRRMGRIVHDDRGNAIVQWEDAPADYERPVLEIESSGMRPGPQHRPSSHSLSLDGPQSFDPYANSGPLERKPPQQQPRTGNTSRMDLRKLSEWIKMMRDLEQRKANAAEDEEEE
jgi:hypothetical protein